MDSRVVALVGRARQFRVQSFEFPGRAMTPFGHEIVTAKEVTAEDVSPIFGSVRESMIRVVVLSFLVNTPSFRPQ